ncbi:MAG TPA: hypothetical protein VF503_12980 [Sphingobium sp.]|uniref:hypothetical protein n=1 Tax=Sphingobium sp. TaxID=1912891 RepID=UPI002ED0EEC2
MEAITKDAMNGSVASAARIASPEERASMLDVLNRHDRAVSDQDVAKILQTFHPDAFFEAKPIGLRATSLESIAEIYRRTMTPLSESFLARRQLREWTNQKGVVREWQYPVTVAPGLRFATRQLEIFEFSDDLLRILARRIRMSESYAGIYAAALGSDIAAAKDVIRVPG